MTTTTSRFVLGQRVRVRQYVTHPECGDPHFIVGHFGHIEAINMYIDVRISRGPAGGPPDRRVYDHLGNFDGLDDDVWLMLPDELEAVD